MNKLLNNLLGMYKQAKLKKSAMIIDEILDRKDGASYNPQDFYDYVSQQLDVLNSKDIATALDSGTEEDVKKALCEYIKLGEYNPAICDYINSVNWLEEEDVEKWFSIKLSDEQAKEFAKLLTENNIKNKSKKEGEEIRVSFFLLPSSIGVAQGLLAATLSKFPDKQASTIKKAEEKESAKKDYTEQYAKVKEIMKEYGYGLSDGGYIYLISKEQPKDEGFQVKFKGDRLRVELDGKLKYSGYGPEAIEDFLKGMFYAKKLSSKNTKLTKKADYTKEEIEMINKEKEKQIECGEMIWKAKDALYGNKIEECKEVVKQMPENCKLNFVVNVKREGEDKYYKKEINEIFKVIPQSLINEADEILKENPNTLYVSEWYRKSSKNSIKAEKNNNLFNSKYKTKIEIVDKKYNEIQTKIKELNDKLQKTNDFEESEKILKEIETLAQQRDKIGEEQNQLYAEWYKEKTKQEKQSSKAKAVAKQAENKEIVVTYEGTDGKEYIIKAPNGLFFNEYVDTDTQHARGAGPFETLEKAKEMFKKHRPSAKEVVATKKKAVLQESENGLGYVLPNGSVVYPGDEEYLQSELKGDKELLEKTKSEIERLEKGMEEIKKEYPEIDLSKYPDSILFKLDRELKLKEAIELSIETIEDILNAFKNKKMGKQATKKQATIKHENGVYNVYSESGKCLGKGYKTKEEAEKRLKQVEYFKNKKANKEDTYEEWGISGDDIDEWFENYTKAKIFFEKNKKDVKQFIHKVYDISGDEPEEIQVDVLYDRDRNINKVNFKTQQNKRTSLKQVVISKMAKNLKNIPDSVKKNILSDLVYVILTGKGSFAYKTVAKKLETIIKDLGYGDKLKANEDGSLPTNEIVELISKEPKAMELAGKFANITRAF